MMQNASGISLVKNIRSYVLYILLLLFTIISLFLISDRARFIFNTKDRIYTETLDRQSEFIRNEILTVSNFIYHYIEWNHNSRELFDYLRTIRYGEKNNGYIFVMSYDGTVLLNDIQKELQGENLWDLEDPNGLKVIQEERKIADNPDGDFLHYFWENPSTGKITPKVSFITGIPEMEWIIGTGVYLDSIEKETSWQVKHIYKNLIIQLAVFLFTMILIFLFIYKKFKNFTFSVSKDIYVINECFNKAEMDSEVFDISRIKYDEFSEIAYQANEMIIRQQRAEKEKRFSDLRLKLQSEQSPLAYVGWDLNNKIIEWNPAAEDMFGYTKEEALGQGIGLIIPDHERIGVEDLFYNLVKTDNRKKNINQNITKDGRIITCEWYNNNLIDSKGDALGIVAVGLDITRRLKSHEEIAQKNIELEKSLKEKNLLVREVHHRVKNNMAIISSLLSLQSSSIKNDYLQSLLQSSQNRIHSMAMVHEHIYRNENLHDVNVRVYITELVEYLMMNFGNIESQVSLNIDIADVNLDLDTLIPLGMMVNEIISNSFKYAFKVDELFELSVILRIMDEDRFYLYIADNGPGFNSKNESVREGAIGLKLIKGLVEQIDGRLKITAEDKTAYEIYF